MVIMRQEEADAQAVWLVLNFVTLNRVIYISPIFEK